jgi:hypothetical protein
LGGSTRRISPPERLTGLNLEAKEIAHLLINSQLFVAWRPRIRRFPTQHVDERFPVDVDLDPFRMNNDSGNDCSDEFPYRER